MTDQEVIRDSLSKLLICDKRCFALVNRFLNLNGYQASVANISDEAVQFSIERKLEN